MNETLFDKAVTNLNTALIDTASIPWAPAMPTVLADTYLALYIDNLLMSFNGAVKHIP